GRGLSSDSSPNEAIPALSNPGSSLGPTLHNASSVMSCRAHPLGWERRHGTDLDSHGTNLDSLEGGNGGAGLDLDSSLTKRSRPCRTQAESLGPTVHNASSVTSCRAHPLGWERRHGADLDSHGTNLDSLEGWDGGARLGV